ncbi:DUF4050 FAMILY PROTEIN [Salix viminalis]|uniref:DUF4050 FAMILY PROTEIN n=1 Tax=Salix viminalis TaxID=40686 RepID=A0A9Q0YZ49_SALVM|nr:DUF4050 FAMILY PROTEIN [Salix viminalis]
MHGNGNATCLYSGTQIDKSRLILRASPDNHSGELIEFVFKLSVRNLDSECGHLCYHLKIEIALFSLHGYDDLQALFVSSGCLGCYHKPALITIVDEKSKGPNVKCETVKKPSISEEFWTTSTCDMDNSAVQSQGSISSINLANQTLDQHGGSSSINNVSEFVNHGLLLWNQTRHCWVGNKSSGNQELLPQEPKLKDFVAYWRSGEKKN